MTHSARLVMPLGQDMEAEYHLRAGARFTIGRHLDNDIVLEKPYISRQHVAIEATHQGFVIRQLSRKNGVCINGRSVRQGLLKDGDAIRVCDFEFTFHQPSVTEVLAQESGGFEVASWESNEDLVTQDPREGHDAEGEFALPRDDEEQEEEEEEEGRPLPDLPDAGFAVAPPQVDEHEGTTLLPLDELPGGGRSPLPAEAVSEAVAEEVAEEVRFEADADLDADSELLGEAAAEPGPEPAEPPAARVDLAEGVETAGLEEERTDQVELDHLPLPEAEEGTELVELEPQEARDESGVRFAEGIQVDELEASRPRPGSSRPQTPSARVTPVGPTAPEGTMGEPPRAATDSSEEGTEFIDMSEVLVQRRRREKHDLGELKRMVVDRTEDGHVRLNWFMAIPLVTFLGLAYLAFLLAPSRKEAVLMEDRLALQEGRAVLVKKTVYGEIVNPRDDRFIVHDDALVSVEQVLPGNNPALFIVVAKGTGETVFPILFKGGDRLDLHIDVKPRMADPDDPALSPTLTVEDRMATARKLMAEGELLAAQRDDAAQEENYFKSLAKFREAVRYLDVALKDIHPAFVALKAEARTRTEESEGDWAGFCDDLQNLFREQYEKEDTAAAEATLRRMLAAVQDPNDVRYLRCSAYLEYLFKDGSK